MAANPRYEPPQDDEQGDSGAAATDTEVPGAVETPVIGMEDPASPVHILQKRLTRAFAPRSASGSHGVNGIGLALSVIAGAIVAGTYLNYRGLWLF